YLIARQELMRNDGWGSCKPDATTRTPLTDAVVNALVQDHLSPAVARMVAVDGPHLPWSPTRGQALLESWQSALVTSLVEGGVSKKGEKPAAFAQRLGDLTGGMKHPVAVYFNSTDADSGHIVWFRNSNGGQVGSYFPAKPGAAPDITVDQAHLLVGQAVL